MLVQECPRTAFGDYPVISIVQVPSLEDAHRFLARHDAVNFHPST
jgi:hypothetical protein